MVVIRSRFRFPSQMQAEEEFADLHRDEGEESERKHDEVLLVAEVNEAEEVHESRREGDQRDDGEGRRHGEVEGFVVTLTRAEDAVDVGALIDGVHQLGEGEHHEGHGHGDGVFFLRGGAVEGFRDEVGGEGRRGDEQPVGEDARDDSALEEGAALYGRDAHHVAVCGIDAEGDGGQGIGGEVDEQDVYGKDRVLPAHAEGDEEGEDLRDIARHEELDDLLNLPLIMSRQAIKTTIKK